MGSEADFNRDELEQLLRNILNSPPFIHSSRMKRFLRWVVERTLEDDATAINEVGIATAVYDRDVDFDPKLDTLIRVEARRLRSKLGEYYAGDGHQDPIRIEIPKPGYVPRFIRTQAGNQEPAP
jgi:hypothetical protein